MVTVGATVGIFLSVFISPSPQSCIALTKRMLFSSENNLTLQTPALEENSFEFRKALFVAVIVPGDPSASAIGNTWGAGLSDMELFMARRLAGDSTSVNKAPLQPEWNDPRLVYRVLALLYDRYGDLSYNWYMVVGDDAYVRVNTVVQVLSNLNPEDPLILRRDGIAKLKLVQKKPGPLGPTERGCSLSAGIVFSRGLLKQVAPVVEECLEDEAIASWATERKADIERCVSRKLGARCLWNHELPTEQFFVDAASLSGHDGPTGALSVHGLNDPAHFLSLHYSYLRMALNASESLSQTLRNELAKEGA